MKLTLIIVLVCSLAIVYGQDTSDNSRVFYFAVGAGPSLLVNPDKGYSKGAASLQISLLNFGFVSKRNFGVSLGIQRGVHSFQEKLYWSDGSAFYPYRVDARVVYNTVMAGPTYTIRLNKRSNLDLKARLGRFSFKERTESSDLIGQASYKIVSLGYSIDAAYRLQVSRHWNMIVSVDYSSGRASQTLLNSHKNLNVLSLTGAIGFQF